MTNKRLPKHAFCGFLCSYQVLIPKREIHQHNLQDKGYNTNRANWARQLRTTRRVRTTSWLIVEGIPLHFAMSHIRRHKILSVPQEHTVPTAIHTHPHGSIDLFQWSFPCAMINIMTPTLLNGRDQWKSL